MIYVGKTYSILDKTSSYKMAQEVEKDIIDSLKVDGNGWSISLFDDQSKASMCVCDHCKSVCCDAVELACAHEEEHILLYCHKCLKQLIEDVDGNCPIDGHELPDTSNKKTNCKIIGYLSI